MTGSRGRGERGRGLEGAQIGVGGEVGFGGACQTETHTHTHTHTHRPTGQQANRPTGHHKMGHRELPKPLITKRNAMWVTVCPVDTQRCLATLGLLERVYDCDGGIRRDPFQSRKIEVK